MKASSAETVSFLSVSAEGSRSASTQKRAKTVAFFSLPLLVAVITTRLAFSSAARDPPLALVMFTTNWRVQPMRSSSAPNSTPEMSGPGRFIL